MGIKYYFSKKMPKERQKNWMAWHTINVEQDVQPIKVKQKKDHWEVDYETDGMTAEETNKWLFKSGYFKNLKKDPKVKM